MSLRKLFLIALLSLLHVVPTEAQNDDSRQLLTDAENAYQIGKIEEVMDILQGKVGSMNSALKLRAYRLLSLCALAIEQPEKAREYAIKMLSENPYYTPTVDYPPRFIDLVKDIKQNMEETKITTASNQSESMNEAPTPITIITSEMIEELGYNKNLNQILATYVPGMTEIAAENPGENLAMHGAYSDNQEMILVMENGHRLNNRFNNAGPLSYNISTEKIDHIEVLRGPASSLYGDVALSAVVNIITKNGSSVNGVNARYGYGSFGTHRADIMLGTQFMDADITAWASLYKSDGQTRHYSDGEGFYLMDKIENDYVKSYGPDKIYVDSYKGVPSFDIGFTFRLKGFNLMLSRKRFCKLYQNSGELGYDYDLYPVISGNSPGYSDDGTHIELGYTRQIGKILLNATAYGDYKTFVNYKPNYDRRSQPNEYQDEDEEETDSIWSWTNADYLAIKEFSYGGYLSASADYRLGSMNGNIQAGGQFEHYSFQSATSLNIVNDEISYGGYQDQTLDKQGKENSLSLFVQDKHYFIPELILNAGLRYDIKYHVNNNNLKKFSPRLALMYVPNKRFTLKLSYAEAFADLNFYYRYMGYEDKYEKEPLHMSALQLTAMGQIVPLKLSYEVNLFYNKWDQMMRWHMRWDDEEEYVIHNNGQMENIGIEGNTRYTGKRFTGNLTIYYCHDTKGYRYYYNSIEGITNNVPHFTANLHGSYQLLQTSNHALKVYGTASYRNRILNYGSFEETDFYISDKLRFDLGVKYSYRQNLGIALDCENIFDTDLYVCGPNYRKHPLFQRGRTLMASISCHF